jgi:hypothetical protein
MKVTPIVREATESDLPAILAIYNEVIATSTAVYAIDASTLEERRTWYSSRRAMASRRWSRRIQSKTMFSALLQYEDDCSRSNRACRLVGGGAAAVPTPPIGRECP